jgi:hypothetical protein
MVNNHQKEAKSHSPLFFVVVFILLMVFVTNTTKAQKIKKYYVSSKQDKGTLFFIRPQKGFKNKHLGSRLTYDITCFSGADSLTFNFSYFDKQIRNLDSICLLMPAKRGCVSLNKLFVDTQKSYWQYRFSSRMAIKDLEVFFSGDEERAIQLIQKEQRLVLTCSKRKWKKNAGITTRIFQLIQYNN